MRAMVTRWWVITMKRVSVRPAMSFSFEVSAPATTPPVANLEMQLTAAREQMAKLESSRERIAVSP